MPTVSVFDYSGNRVQPLKDPEKGMDVVLLEDATYDMGQLVAFRIGNAENQRITKVGAVTTSGTFTLDYDGDVTAAIAYNASAQDVEDALNLLASVIAAGGVTCTGGALPGTAVNVFFNEFFNAVTLVIDNTGLAGGGAANAITTVLAGVPTSNKFAKYSSSAVDGRQYPLGILEYDVRVTSGLHSIGDQTSGEWRQTELGAPMYRGGLFECADLVGLDATAITNMRARLIQGDASTGRILIPG